jgi:hypothetical protein
MVAGKGGEAMEAGKAAVEKVEAKAVGSVEGETGVEETGVVAEAVEAEAVTAGKAAVEKVEMDPGLQ